MPAKSPPTTARVARPLFTKVTLTLPEPVGPPACLQEAAADEAADDIAEEAALTLKGGSAVLATVAAGSSVGPFWGSAGAGTAGRWVAAVWVGFSTDAGEGTAAADVAAAADAAVLPLADGGGCADAAEGTRAGIASVVAAVASTAGVGLVGASDAGTGAGCCCFLTK